MHTVFTGLLYIYIKVCIVLNIKKMLIIIASTLKNFQRIKLRRIDGITEV